MPVAHSGRLATAPLAAVGQVRAHRRARTVGVFGRRWHRDALVLGVHLQQVGAPLGLGHAGAVQPRARNDDLRRACRSARRSAGSAWRARCSRWNWKSGAIASRPATHRRSNWSQRLAQRRPGCARCAAARPGRRPRSRCRCAARAPRSRRAAWRSARARCGSRPASPAPTTKVPTPCRVSTSPAACSLEMASRTTVRLTPNSCITAASVGSLSPGDRRPSRMRSPSASTSSSASVRGRRGERRAQRVPAFGGNPICSH